MVFCAQTKLSFSCVSAFYYSLVKTNTRWWFFLNLLRIETNCGISSAPIQTVLSDPCYDGICATPCVSRPTVEFPLRARLVPQLAEEDREGRSKESDGACVLVLVSNERAAARRRLWILRADSKSSQTKAAAGRRQIRSCTRGRSSRIGTQLDRSQTSSAWTMARRRCDYSSPPRPPCPHLPKHYLNLRDDSSYACDNDLSFIHQTVSRRPPPLKHVTSLST
jgi:hypothetical protein